MTWEKTLPEEWVDQPHNECLSPQVADKGKMSSPWLCGGLVGLMRQRGKPGLCLWGAHKYLPVLKTGERVWIRNTWVADWFPMTTPKWPWPKENKCFSQIHLMPQLHTGARAARTEERLCPSETEEAQTGSSIWKEEGQPVAGAYIGKHPQQFLLLQCGCPVGQEC